VRHGASHPLWSVFASCVALNGSHLLGIAIQSRRDIHHSIRRILPRKPDAAELPGRPDQNVIRPVRTSPWL
jgi:hypothetical protein